MVLFKSFKDRFTFTNSCFMFIHLRFFALCFRAEGFQSEWDSKREEVISFELSTLLCAHCFRLPPFFRQLFPSSCRLAEWVYLNICVSVSFVRVWLWCECAGYDILPDAGPGPELCFYSPWETPRVNSKIPRCYWTKELRTSPQWHFTGCM